MLRPLILVASLLLPFAALAQSSDDKAATAPSDLVDQAVAVATEGMPPVAPEAKATLVECFGTEFAKMTPDDLTVLIQTDFNPGAEFDAQLEDRYPGLKQAVVSCAKAVMPR